MADLEKYFKGLADLNRLRILNLLLSGERCGCDLQYVLDSSQPNISRHLQYLKNSGLVRDRRDGFRVYYRVTDARSGLRKLLFEFLLVAFSNEEPFRRDTNRLKEAISQGACTVSEKSSNAGVPPSRPKEFARA